MSDNLFDRLYLAANRETSRVHWSSMDPHPLLTCLLATSLSDAPRGPALALGCGLGGDAVAVLGAGYTVTAVDSSSEAIRWCNELHAGTSIEFLAIDACQLPTAWISRFALVVDFFAISTMGSEQRLSAMSEAARCVRDGGQILSVQRTCSMQRGASFDNACSSPSLIHGLAKEVDDERQLSNGDSIRVLLFRSHKGEPNRA